MSSYVDRVIEQVRSKNPDQPEFLQTVTEVLKTVEPVVNKHPEYEQAALLERSCSELYGRMMKVKHR